MTVEINNGCELDEEDRETSHVVSQRFLMNGAIRLFSHRKHETRTSSSRCYGVSVSI